MRSRRLAGIYLAFTLSNLGYSLWYSLFPVYLSNLGLEAWQIGFIFSLLSLSTSLSYMILGSISDSAGRGKPLITGFIFSALTTIALAFSPNPLLTGFLILLYGLLEGLKMPTGEATIADTGMSLGLALSIFYLAIMSSRIVGSALSGYLAIILGFQILFALAGVLNILSASAVALLYGWSGSLNLEAVKLSFRRFPKGVRLILSDRVLSRFTIALVFHSLGFSMVNPLIALYAKEALSLDEGRIGILIAVWNTGLLVTQIPSGKLADKLGGIPMLAAHIALSSFSWMLYGLSGGWLEAVFSALIMGVVGALDMPARRTIMVHLKGSMGVASIIGYMDALTSLTFMLGSSVGGVLWSSLGYKAPFTIAAVVNIFALIFLLF